MTDTEIRTAIAEACGWKVNEIKQLPQRKIRVYGVPPEMVKKGMGWEYNHRVPDYLNDLNAMHEAEKTLDVYQSQNYANELGKLIAASIRWTFHATARQRCESFLKVKGLWK